MINQEKNCLKLQKKRYPADEYYILGDSVNADIIGGNNAGVTTVLVHSRYDKNADYCFNDLKSVLKLFCNK
ncbi:MAG: HAD hydrolase-like protein [Eubacterium sp.]